MNKASFTSPKQVLKEILGLDIDSSDAVSKRPSTLPENISNEKVGAIEDFARQDSADKLYSALDDYLYWKSNPFGEPEKNIKFLALIKTKFACQLLDLPYTGNYSQIVKDCKASDRRYRLRCTDFDPTRKDTETQLSLLILYEAFKNSSKGITIEDCITQFRCKFQQIFLTDVLKLIVEKFCYEPDITAANRLLVINLDETDALLNSQAGIDFFRKLLQILQWASQSFTLVTILSATDSVALFGQSQVSCLQIVDIT
jgi:hypothetical protein